jgi:hypothetical protein
MKTFPIAAALCAALALAPLAARAEGDVAVTDADLQRLLGPTLRSVQVEASSSGGFVALTLPNGTPIRQPISIPRFTIPVPILPDIECDVLPMRSAGAPTFSYRDGWMRLHIRLMPTTGNLVARTNSFYPNVTAPSIDIEMRFRLETATGGLRIGQFQTTTTGAIDLTGAGSPFSPLVRERIQRDISTNVEAQLRPRLSLLVGLVVPGYLQSATGYGSTLRIGGVRHDPDRVVFTVTGQTQRPPRPVFNTDISTTFAPGVLSSLLKLSDSEVSANAKKCEADAKAQAEADKKLSEKYSAEKPGKNAQGGSGKEKGK